MFPWKHFDSNIITKVSKEWVNQSVDEQPEIFLPFTGNNADPSINDPKD